jgi:hypothetical protein
MRDVRDMREPRDRLDFDTLQPRSNANAPAVRVIQKHPRRAVPSQGNVDFDEIQPASNANASPFGHTLTLRNRAPRGNAGNGSGNADANQATFNPRGNRSGPRGRPNKNFRGNKGPHPQRQRPRDVDGNVAPREESAPPIHDDE